MGLQALVMLSLSLSEKSFIQWIALSNVCATGAESDTVDSVTYTITGLLPLDFSPQNPFDLFHFFYSSSWLKRFDSNSLFFLL